MNAKPPTQPPVKKSILKKPQLPPTESNNNNTNNTNTTTSTNPNQSKTPLNTGVLAPSSNTEYSTVALSASDLIYKRMERYREKLKPRERMEIDIVPSLLSYSNNKLLVASANGKIRVIDLLTYKIQKDELKNLLISSICTPKSPESRDR